MTKDQTLTEALKELITQPTLSEAVWGQIDKLSDKSTPHGRGRGCSVGAIERPKTKLEQEIIRAQKKDKDLKARIICLRQYLRDRCDL